MTAIPPKSPIAEANRLSMLLNIGIGGERFPVDVEWLAREYASQFGQRDPISSVIGSNLPGFEGALYGVEKNQGMEWVLIYNSDVKVAGRIRFTVAHELGHYILHRSGRDTFECSESDMLHWDHDGKKMEAEADAFASSLLMPIDDYRRQIGNEVVDMDVLGACASRYGVSLTAAVLKWLEFTSQRAILVMSRDGFILWSRSSPSALKSGAFFRTKGKAVSIPGNSLAAARESLASERQGIELPAKTWFQGEPNDMSLREMKIVSDQYDQVMSLLILPPHEPAWKRTDEGDGGDSLDNHIRSGRFSRR